MCNWLSTAHASPNGAIGHGTHGNKHIWSEAFGPLWQFSFSTELWYQHVLHLFFFLCGERLKWAWDVNAVGKRQSRHSSRAICQTFAISAIKVLSYVCSLIKCSCVLCFDEPVFGLPMCRCSCDNSTSDGSLQSFRILFRVLRGNTFKVAVFFKTAHSCSTWAVVSCRM